MLVSFRVPLRWTDILKRTIAEMDEDNCLGLAAQLAFYFFLALFPAFLFLVALIGYLPIENMLAEMLDALGTVAPTEVLELLRTQLDELARGSHGSLLTLGIAGAVWSSSAAMVAIINALNHAYDVAERRPWWKRRLVGIGLTIALALFIVMSLGLVLAGPSVASKIADWLGLGAAFGVLWAIARWPLIIFLVVLGVDLVYHFAPNRRGTWVWITPGSLLATSLWILSSFVFRLYVANLANFNATHGAIGGVVVLLLWFYVSSLAVLVGAELNGVIEQAWRTFDADRRHRQRRT
jgi:membrane protein